LAAPKSDAASGPDGFQPEACAGLPEGLEIEEGTDWFCDRVDPDELPAFGGVARARPGVAEGAAILCQ
jgi:hypothetical protein